MTVSTYHPKQAQTFDQVIAGTAALVDFYADWCGPCQAMAPTLEAFAEANQNVNVVKVNIDENPELAARFGIRSIPTLLAFHDGREHGRAVGVTNQAGLAELVA